MIKVAVSVVMSVYNGEKYLREAIESILNQTFSDFEFIIIDDGSKDRTKEIVQSYKDSRIILVSRDNKGLTESLNEGIKLSRGKYIARQDADDISDPDRLRQEFIIMEGDPDLGLVGSNYKIITTEGKYLTQSHAFTHPDDLKVAEVLSHQFGHGSVMIRKLILNKVGLYDKLAGVVEDYDLFARISRVAKIANISRPLYSWRKNPEGISSTNSQVQLELTDKIIDREFKDLLKNRSNYKVLSSWHPDGLRYFMKKSNLFFDLALFYRQHNRTGESYIHLIMSIILAPFRLKAYWILLLLPWKEQVLRKWRYVYL